MEAAAWVSYALKSYKRELGPLPDWFVTGEENWELIPFVAEQRTYRARPHCRIDRDYARPLRRKLQEDISWLEGEAEATCSFDGRVLSIKLRRSCLRSRGTGRSLAVILPGGCIP